MISRKRFILSSALASTAAMLGIKPVFSIQREKVKTKTVRKPVVISTWNHGLAANEAA